MKKTKELRKSLKDAEEARKAAEEALALAEKENQELVQSVKEQISQLAEENDLFCGVILSHQALVEIFALALKTGESIKIEFGLFPKTDS